MSTEKIAFVVRDREIVADGLVKVSISLPASNKTGVVDARHLGRLGANELPYILHTLRHTKYFDPSAHVGFDYLLDGRLDAAGGFPLERGYGFPYVLDFEIINDKPSLT